MALTWPDYLARPQESTLSESKGLLPVSATTWGEVVMVSLVSGLLGRLAVEYGVKEFGHVSKEPLPHLQQLASKIPI